MTLTITDDDIDLIEMETGLSFDEPRRLALKGYDDIQACPGSGKTTLIAAKLILLASKWNQGSNGICVLSHTNVAKFEIISRLEKHPDGRRLLKYPHFIGTIQEFVNRFLAIPYCRTVGIPVNQIDDEICCNYINSKLKWGTRKYLENKRASIGGLQVKYEKGEFVTSVPAFPSYSNSNSYQDLASIKNSLIGSGLHFYREMYEYGKAYVDTVSGASEALRSRFRIVFVDEMQDTEYFQDHLINSIFDTEYCQVQRFGDADQAIFNSGDGSNTYNDLDLPAITTSHRFNSSIAKIVSGLSSKRLTICSSHEATKDDPPNTIFVVSEKTRGQVISSFVDLCIEHIHSDEVSPIKVVGAVGNENPTALTIGEYFPNFHKSQASNNFKPQKLIDYFYKIEMASSNHKSYRLVLDGVARCYRIAGVQLSDQIGDIKPVTVDRLRRWLKDTDKLKAFNQMVLSLQFKDFTDEGVWIENLVPLIDLLELDIDNPGVSEFTSFKEREITTAEDSSSLNICSVKRNGRSVDVEISTIHSVKGETHAATLVLETQFHQYDIGQMMDYLVGVKTDSPLKRKAKFMKQLYVAMTRPKHLVCLAIDESRFSGVNRERAIQQGWNIKDLTIIASSLQHQKLEETQQERPRAAQNIEGGFTYTSRSIKNPSRDS
ncbi:UvrD-helicase domain-containing protein [Alkalimarinus alittae]|uniref:DNA 3'-5' helicase II n=1 Tax=Alkalimarinus alittae TaxID=2961619 RepID=A0ABY6N6A4_9ALTE|nr:UvrD-helicase domain-containing protein [Alkalimarinus alittae]UZE97641.1 UvrD-helicase domain-containing protein [Alkalimarinus alittae]